MTSNGDVSGPNNLGTASTSFKKGPRDEKASNHNRRELFATSVDS